MKKNLLALAVLSACSASFAQSSATVFGVVDLAYESVKTNAGSISGISPSGNAASRLGLRGVEDLGGGMAASFWLEAAINPSSGIGSSGTTSNNQKNDIAAGGLTFNRRSTVGLVGNFGEVRLGRDTTPSWQNYLNADPFGAAGVGTLILDGTGSAYTNTFVRASNSVGYFLPKDLGGVYGQAMYAFPAQPPSTTSTPPATDDSHPQGWAMRKGRWTLPPPIRKPLLLRPLRLWAQGACRAQAPVAQRLRWLALFQTPASLGHTTCPL
jgi:predicted porin